MLYEAVLFRHLTIFSQGSLFQSRLYRLLFLAKRRYPSAQNQDA
jgi:hypothetical protein